MTLKKLVILSERAYRSTIENLQTYGYKVILSSVFYGGMGSLATHIDLQIFPYYKDFLVISPNISIHVLKSLLGYRLKKNFVFGYKFLKNGYPYDIPYNAIKIDKYLFANLKYVDPIILKIARLYDLTPVHVNQGYVRCTTLPLKDSALITEDPGIYKKVKNLGLDVLYLPHGNIEIDDFSYGFLAGSSGVVNDIIYINGDIDTYIYKDKFLQFIKERGFRVMSLSPKRNLKDIGSIFFLTEDPVLVGGI